MVAKNAPTGFEQIQQLMKNGTEALSRDDLIYIVGELLNLLICTQLDLATLLKDIRLHNKHLFGNELSDKQIPHVRTSSWVSHAAQDIYNMMWSVKCRNVKLPTVEMIAEMIESYHNEDIKLDDNEQIA